MGGRKADLTSPVRRNVPGALATGVAGIASQKLPKGFLIGYGRNRWLAMLYARANIPKCCMLCITDWPTSNWPTIRSVQRIQRPHRLGYSLCRGVPLRDSLLRASAELIQTRPVVSYVRKRHRKRK
jgi:hypothetical protein